MNHRDFDAWICSDGRKLETYVHQIDGYTVKCYIASEPGKVRAIVVVLVNLKPWQPFSVHWRDLSGGSRIRGTVYVDGVRACGSVSKGYAGEVVDRSECMLSPTTCRELIFSALDLTDDENAVEAGPNIGTIKIKLSKVVLVGMNGVRKYNGVDRLASPPLVNERVKKLNAHCVSLGRERPEVAHKVVQTRPLDPSNTGPHVIFEFLYRSRGECAIMQTTTTDLATEWLETQSIIAVKDEGSNSVSPATDVKEDNIHAQVAALRDQLVKLEELAQLQQDVKPKMPQLELLCKPGTIIDLTSD